MLGVPSRSISVWSIAACSVGAGAGRAPSAISPLTLATAFVTPLPSHVLAAVAQLDRLELAGGGARGHGGAAGRAGIERDVDLDRRVAPRVEDLARVDALRSSGTRGPGALSAAARSRNRSAAARRASSGSTPQPAREVAPASQQRRRPTRSALAARSPRVPSPAAPAARPAPGSALHLARVEQAPAGSPARRRTGRRRPGPRLALDRGPSCAVPRAARSSASRASRRRRAGGGGSASRASPSATSARSPAPRSSSSSARK